MCVCAEIHKHDALLLSLLFATLNLPNKVKESKAKLILAFRIQHEKSSVCDHVICFSHCAAVIATSGRAKQKGGDKDHKHRFSGRLEGVRGVGGGALQL